jgi:hypothetical protein
MGQMIDAGAKTIEPFGKLWRLETWEERTEVPAGQLIGLNCGRSRVS